MPYAQVGTAPAWSIGAGTNTAVTPSWGAGQSRTAGNLLILFVNAYTLASTVATPSGWSGGNGEGLFANGTQCGCTLFYKIAAGSDAAPTIPAGPGILWGAWLNEYSGNAPSLPLDRAAQNVSTTSPVTATAAGLDVATGELLVTAVADQRSAARTPNDTFTSNHGTVTVAASNNGVSSVNHYSAGHIVGTTTNAAAATSVMTASVTTSLTGLSLVMATFKLPSAAAADVLKRSDYRQLLAH